MRMSRMLMPTLKEVPSDAEITSHPFVSIHKYRVGRFFCGKFFTIKNKKYK